MMELPEGDWITITEAARGLGVKRISLHRAVARGRLSARTMGRWSVVSIQDVERYRQEHLGKGGWQRRRAPDYEPSPNALRLRRYRDRKKARRQADEPAAREGAARGAGAPCQEEDT